MKYLKILGLAAIAAMAVMAFVGAGTASATVICKTTATPCGSPATELEASLTGTATLSAEGTTLDTCTGGTVNGTIEEQGATKTAKGKVKKEGLTWTGCSKTTTTNEGGELEAHWISKTENGTVTVRGFVVTVQTIFGSCTFGFGTVSAHLGELKGGSPGTLAINTTVPRISGLCPATANWVANYTVTTPNPVYVLES